MSLPPTSTSAGDRCPSPCRGKGRPSGYPRGGVRSVLPTQGGRGGWRWRWRECFCPLPHGAGRVSVGRRSRSFWPRLASGGLGGGEAEPPQGGAEARVQLRCGVGSHPQGEGALRWPAGGPLLLLLGEGWAASPALLPPFPGGGNSWSFGRRGAGGGKCEGPAPRAMPCRSASEGELGADKPYPTKGELRFPFLLAL